MRTRIKLLVKERITLENLSFVDDLNGWDNTNFYIYNQTAISSWKGRLRQTTGLQSNNWYRVSYSRDDKRGATNIIVGGNPGTIRGVAGRYTEDIQSFGTSFEIYSTGVNGIWNITIEPLSYVAHYLDLYEDEPIQITYQTFDIETLERAASYSKTFKIPATNTNNQIFEFANIIESNQNKAFLNRRIQCEVYIDDVKTFEGNLYLNSINRDDFNNIVEYEVSMYSFNLDLFATLGDELLVGNDDTAKDLDFSLYSNKLNVKNIIDSWDTHWIPGVTKTEESLGVVWPPILSMNTSTYEKPKDNLLYAETQRPAFFVKEIMDKIFEQANFTYTSSFFDTDFFKSLIIPSSDKTDNLQLDKLLYTFRAGIPDTVRINKDEANGYDLKFFYKQVGSGDAGDEYAQKLWKVPYSNDNKTSDLLTPWYDSWNYLYDNFNTTNREATIRKTGKYKFRATCSVRFRLENLDKSNILNVKGKGDDGDLPVKLLLVQKRGNTTVKNFPSQAFPIFPNLEFQAIQLPILGYSGWSEWVNCDLDVPALDCQEGDIVKIYLYNYSFHDQNITITDQLGRKQATRLVAYEFEMKEADSIFYSEVVNSDEINYNEIIDPSKWLPNIKKIDFIIEIAKLFNLKLDDKTNKTKHILIEPYEDYYKLGRTKDFTKLHDTSSEVFIRRNENLIDKYIDLTMSEAEDYYNAYYEEQYGKIFGRQILLSEENSREVFELKSKFKPMIMKKLDSCSTLQLPYFDNTLQSTIDNWKFTNLGLRIGCWHDSDDLNSPRARFKFSQGDTMKYTMFGYPEDYPSFSTGSYIGFMGPIYDINSYYIDNTSAELNTNEITYDDNLLYYNVSSEYYAPINLTNERVPTLYNKFYKIMFDETFSINSKLVDMNIILSPSELYNLYLYDTIYVEPNYYRIIKIHDYNNLNYNTKLTLLLLSDSIIPRRYRVTKKQISGKSISSNDGTKLSQKNPGILATTQLNIKDNDGVFNLNDVNFSLNKALRLDKNYGIVNGKLNQIGYSDGVFVSGDYNRIKDGTFNVSVFGGFNDVEFSNVLQTSQTILSKNAGVINSVVIDFGKIEDKTYSSSSPVNYIEGGRTDVTKFQNSYTSANYIDPISDFVLGDLEDRTGLVALKNDVKTFRRLE